MGTRIRLASLADAEAIAGIYRHFVLETPVSFEAAPPDREEIARRIADLQSTHPWLILERGSEFAGYAYASPHRARFHYQWSVDVTVYVHEDHRRQGVGKALYTSLLSLVPLLGYYRAHAGITLPNAGSVSLHESMGFEPVGVYRSVGYKLGKWHDVGWWQKTLLDSEDEPATPLTVASLVDSPSWNLALHAGEQLL